MTRGGGMAFSGLAFLVGALLLGVWGSGAFALRVSVTLLLCAGITLSALAIHRILSDIVFARSESKDRQERLQNRLDSLEEADAATSRGTVESEDLGRLREQMILNEADFDSRLQVLASELSKIEDGNGAGRTHAEGDDTSARASQEELVAFESRVRANRSADHVRLADAENGLYELAIHAGVPLSAVLSPGQARLLVSRYARSSDYLRVKPLLDDFADDYPELLDQLETVRLVAAYKVYKRLGYLDAQARVAQSLRSRSDSSVPEHKLLASIEDSVFFGDVRAFEPPDLGGDDGVYDPSGPVVHVVGKVLPDTQSGYTLRTQYSVRSLQSRGTECVVLCQAGAPGGDAERLVDQYVQGIRCITVPGPVRYETTYAEWLSATIAESAKVVRRLRPRVLHAHSDFLNAMVAVHLGRAYGIPVAYESRGFWEESWLSRTLDAHAGGYEDLVRRAGVPEAYSRRQAAEVALREDSDVNLTLGRTMRAHIIELAAPGPIAPDDVHIVPNGIEPGLFDGITRDERLAASLGLSSDDVVIGCVSSIVEYEGIDVLVRAFERLEASKALIGRPRLLIVGDGAQLESLQRLADELGVQGAIFTGRVPHEHVLSYYSLIDVFVVPRRPTPVSRLVTPLKPFEALASGRAVVVSDVDALREIAEDAEGAIAQFRAGDARDLERVLATLIGDPARRERMGHRGAEWVFRERTWDANSMVYEAVYRELDARAHRTAPDAS